MFGNWLFGSTVIVVLFVAFYLLYKKERYVSQFIATIAWGSLVYEFHYNYEATHVGSPSFTMISLKCMLSLETHFMKCARDPVG